MDGWNGLVIDGVINRPFYVQQQNSPQTTIANPIVEEKGSAMQRQPTTLIVATPTRKINKYSVSIAGVPIFYLLRGVHPHHIELWVHQIFMCCNKHHHTQPPLRMRGGGDKQRVCKMQWNIY